MIFRTINSRLKLEMAAHLQMILKLLISNWAQIRPITSRQIIRTTQINRLIQNQVRKAHNKWFWNKNNRILIMVNLYLRISLLPKVISHSMKFAKDKMDLMKDKRLRLSSDRHNSNLEMMLKRTRWLSQNGDHLLQLDQHILLAIWMEPRRECLERKPILPLATISFHNQISLCL